MRTRSPAVTSLLAASVAVAIIACTPDSTAPADVSPPAPALDRKVKELEEKYGWIGKYHTEGLEYVYSELSRSGGKRDQKSLCRTIDRAVRDFHRSKGKGDIPFHLMDASVFAGPCDEIRGDRATGSRTIVPGAEWLSADEVSPLTLSYIDQVQTAVFSETTKSGLLSTLLHIQNAAATTLPLDEAGVVIGTISVVISSMEYWEVNLEAWIGLADGPGIAYSIDAAAIPGVSAQTSFWPRFWTNPFMQAFKKVVAADGMAAARVLYTTWRLGPIGWDAAAAAGVFGSITTAISLQI
jgi:hypothetical protein